MKKGDIVAGTVEKVSFPNRGTVLLEDGSRLMVKNVVPGQKIEARVTHLRRNKGEGNLVSVLEKSSLEQDPQCPHFGTCGGCVWLSMKYEAELEMKADQVRALLVQAAAEAGLPEIPFEGILPSPKVYEYRNKMEFTFGDAFKGGPMEIGMHRRGGFYDIVTVSGCRLVDEDYRRIISFTKSYFGPLCENGTVKPYHRMNHTGDLRHLLVRKAANTGEILIDLVTAPLPEDASPEEKERRRQVITGFAEGLAGLRLDGSIAGILHTENAALSDTIRDDGTEILYGRAGFDEKLLGLTFTVTPFSFFQTNSKSAELLYTTARNMIRETGVLSGEKPVIFDLYSGTGTIAQMLSPEAREVVGVEIVEEAVEAAKLNAERNGIANCSFIAGDVLKVLDELDKKPDFIVLDPPRDGIHPKALPKLVSYGVPYILYISCKATSLARDIPEFAKGGYVPVRVVAVDQFPHTANVECIALLQRMSGTSEKTMI